MLKLAAVGVLTILVSCFGFFGYTWYQNRPPSVENGTAEVSNIEVKTDFISIAVFKDGAVDGYITFRAKLMLKNEDRLAEAEYMIADTIHRKLAKFSELFGENLRLKDTKVIEDPLLASLVDKLGAGEITSLELTDLAYDKRIR